MITLDGSSLPHVRVSLPMYNLPEMRAQNAAFWTAMRTELEACGVGGLPVELDYDRKPVPAEIERDTLFSQVCGYPLQTIFRGQAVLLGAPVYTDAYSNGPTHCGIFIVAREAPYRTLADLRGCRFAFNSIHSNSGMNLPRRAIADVAGGAPFFGSIAETHSHPGNVERVAKGEIDATCVDCVTYAFLERHRPSITNATRVLAPTPPSPSIPFVTTTAAPPKLREALTTALMRVARADEWAEARAGLLLADIAPIANTKVYEDLLNYADQAKALGYPDFR
ncbi:MAG: phosphate ABC transporter substrate-binding protein [Hyphomicrobiales bacterium]|nr:MAG: phosphate ABC transporter substrate-binding protein [Hyphomicrobiales bacterium]